MSPNERGAKYLILEDGRQLCYAEYGDPNGEPVFLFHGNPLSRLMWGLIPGSPFLPNVRLIAPDRPGYGQSDYRHGITTVESWPEDVAQLADALGIDRFAVFGPSGGGPYALACGWRIPERITAVGVFASVGPLNDRTCIGLRPAIKKLWKTANRAPWLIKTQIRLMAVLARRTPAFYTRLVASELSAPDRELFQRLNLAETNIPDRNEGYRQGGIGSWYDTTLPCAWPIPLKEVGARVLLWQGEEDESVPPAMGREIAALLSDCDAEFISGASHFWLYEHTSEMLAKLLDRDPTD